MQPTRSLKRTVPALLACIVLALGAMACNQDSEAASATSSNTLAASPTPPTSTKSEAATKTAPPTRSAPPLASMACAAPRSPRYNEPQTKRDIEVPAPPNTIEISLNAGEQYELWIHAPDGDPFHAWSVEGAGADGQVQCPVESLPNGIAVPIKIPAPGRYRMFDVYHPELEAYLNVE